MTAPPAAPAAPTDVEGVASALYNAVFVDGPSWLAISEDRREIWRSRAQSAIREALRLVDEEAK